MSSPGVSVVPERRRIWALVGGLKLVLDLQRVFFRLVLRRPILHGWKKYHRKLCLVAKRLLGLNAMREYRKIRLVKIKPFKKSRYNVSS